MVSALPRVLPLGEEYIIVARRGAEGAIRIEACTLVVDTYRNKTWGARNLVEPLYEFSPRLFQNASGEM